MAKTFDVRKTAITLGLVFALCHLGWAVFVAVGGSGFLNWVMSTHFISTPFATSAFDVVTLITGLISAFIDGAVIGAVFAYIYNKL